MLFIFSLWAFEQVPGEKASIWDWRYPSYNLMHFEAGSKGNEVTATYTGSSNNGRTKGSGISSSGGRTAKLRIFGGGRVLEFRKWTMKGCCPLWELAKRGEKKRLGKWVRNQVEIQYSAILLRMSSSREFNLAFFLAVIKLSEALTSSSGMRRLHGLEFHPREYWAR